MSYLGDDLEGEAGYYRGSGTVDEEGWFYPYEDEDRDLNQALQRASQGNSAPEGNSIDRKVESVMGVEFETGNSVVADLAEGTFLQVVGPGRLAVVDAPAAALVEDEIIQASLEPGDEVETKHGFGHVVRLTSRFAEYDSEADTLYIAEDGDYVVRIL